MIALFHAVVFTLSELLKQPWHREVINITREIIDALDEL